MRSKSKTPRCKVLQIAMAVVAVLAIGCPRDIPVADDQPPLLTVIVGAGSENNTFSSADEPWPIGEDCIRVDPPVTLTITASDNVGVGTVIVSVLSGNFDPASIAIAPASPESSFSVEASSPTSERFSFTLAPLGDGTARPSAVATVDIVGSPPIAITGAVRDTAGNFSNLGQVDIQAIDSGVFCRGDG